ncbi:MAG: hypothetical protein MJ200_05985 [Mycoplasmoidaceae bacterium]|nr:hypothetical protein [Mycoplasmoidaceae bacterium]
MTNAFTYGSLAILAAQLTIGAFDPAINAAIAAKIKPETDAIQQAEKSKNLYQRIVSMFKSLYSSTKN